MSLFLCMVLVFCVTPWTVDCQVPLSKGFSRQEHWSRLPFLLYEIFLTQGLNPCLLCFLQWQADASNVLISFFTCSGPVFSAPLIEETVSSPSILLPLCQRVTDHGQLMGLFLGFLPCFVDLCVFFGARTILFWLQQLWSIVWNQEVRFLWLCISFSRLLWLFEVFRDSIQI